MFNDKIRPSKEQNQKVAQDWLVDNTTIKKFKSVGISGGNAINSVKSIGRLSKDITLYEIDTDTAIMAKKNYTSNKSSYGLPIKLINDDIYGMDYTKYNLFYFDFCNVYKKVRFNEICDGLQKMAYKTMPKEFVVMFTLPIRGMGVTKKTTFKAFKKFAEDVVLSCTSYSVRTPDYLMSYKGGENGTGMNLTTFPLIFTRCNFDQASQSLSKLKRMKFKDTMTTLGKKKLEAKQHKEITSLILSKKYTNKEIADKYKLSVHTVAAMAAWHVGKFIERKKS